MKYTNLSQTWKLATHLPLKEYIHILPIIWSVSSLFLTVNFIIKGDIFGILAMLLLDVFIALNVIFYPWFRLFLSEAKGTRKYFPIVRTWEYTKNSINETIAAYHNTDYDRTYYLKPDGEIYVETDTRSKRAEMGTTFVKRFLAIPLLKFYILTFFGFLSFALGWIYIPWYINHIHN